MSFISQAGSGNGITDYLDSFAGGAFKNFSLFIAGDALHQHADIYGTADDHLPQSLKKLLLGTMVAKELQGGAELERLRFALSKGIPPRCGRTESRRHCVTPNLAAVR